jgi:hypothetical protein
MHCCNMIVVIAHGNRDESFPLISRFPLLIAKYLEMNCFKLLSKQEESEGFWALYRVFPLFFQRLQEWLVQILPFPFISMTAKLLQKQNVLFPLKSSPKVYLYNMIITDLKMVETNKYVKIILQSYFSVSILIVSNFCQSRKKVKVFGHCIGCFLFFFSDYRNILSMQVFQYFI